MNSTVLPNGCDRITRSAPRVSVTAPATFQRGRRREQADGRIDEGLRGVSGARKRLDHQRRALLKKRS